MDIDQYIDRERLEEVYSELRAERNANYPNLSGLAYLIDDLKLRQAVDKGARDWERKKLEQQRGLDKEG